MKKLVMLVIVTLSLCTRVQAQESEKNIDSLVVARAFSLKTPDELHWSLSGRIRSGETSRRVNMEFKMRASDFAITSLQVDNTKIPLDEPIFGLPIGKDGLIEDVYVHVSAMTANGVFAGQGQASYESVAKDERITITLVPGDLSQEIPLDVPLDERGDVKVVIPELNERNLGFGWGWNEDGKFVLYTPPVFGGLEYTIKRRSDGSTLGSGVIVPFKDVVTPNDAYIGIDYIGNVRHIPFKNGDWAGSGEIQFDSQVALQNGSVVDGKVIFTDVGRAGIEVFVSGEVNIYAWRVTSTGDMPSVPLHIELVGRGGSETQAISLAMELGKIVIAVVPVGDAEQVWINMHRTYGSQGVPVGGKGPPPQ